MAVVNAFVTDNIESKAADTCVAARTTGSIVRTVMANFEVAAADDNASVYRLFKLPPTAIVTSLIVGNDAIAGLTDPQFGIYKPLELGGAVIDVDSLMASVDLHAGAAMTERLVTALANRGKNILQLSGVAAADLQKYGSVDVAMTTPAGVTAAGTVVVELTYAEGV
jgi:hypothetical protein